MRAGRAMLREVVSPIVFRSVPIVWLFSFPDLREKFLVFD